MDNLINTKGKKINNKRELHLFYSTITSFEKLLFTKQNIQTLVIIGQRNITFLNAISELIQLQELWIVECGIKDIPAFKENCLLRKLYLYSNELPSIPNLEACTNLTTLFLSGNDIYELKNIDKLILLQELNLANNKLERINKISWKKSELHYLNLAGNYLCTMKDVQNLSRLQKLNSLVFGDPLYGDCPLVTLCNYRIYVIHYVPRIKKLDHYNICEKERYCINHFFKRQLAYHNVLFYKQLNAHLSLLKQKYKEHEKEMLHFKNQLYTNKINKKIQNYSKNETYEELQHIMLKMESNKKQLVQMKEMANMQLRILQQQLLTNMKYCGNLSFIEYNAFPENTITQLCKRFLEESLCSVIKGGIGITGLKLHKVVKVCNKEIDQFSNWKNEDLQSDECSTILKILISPGVTNIQKWPFNFFKTDLLIKKELMVTNCLAVADCDWLNKIFSTNEDKNILNLYNVCEKRRVCILIQTPIFSSSIKTDSANNYLHMKYANYWNDSSEICQVFKLTNADIRNPMFVIEYEYILNESTNEDKYESSVIPPTVNEFLHVCLSNFNIAQYININERVQLHNLRKICICGQKINSIDMDLDLPNLRELDISFNQLIEFPNSSFMKNVITLNISFNNIQIIHVKEILPTLQELDISWNCLIHCFQSIQVFTALIPNISKLNIFNNPFKDIIDPEVAEYLIHIYLPKLQFINEIKCEDLDLSTYYFPCAFNMCKLSNKRRNKVMFLKQGIRGQVKLKEKKAFNRAKYIHISKDCFTVYNILQNGVNIQEFCATCCLLITFPVVKPLKNLIKLNLGSNFISVLDVFTQQNFPTLKYLDLTNNLITSLEAMGSFHTLQEFYCGNNEIESLVQIDNVKSWKMLYIIDLCNNPINADTLYKKFIIFHLSNVEYISGESVQNIDISEARYIFGNKLDKYVLNGIYKPDRLINITQLSLVGCSLSKVDLSSECLPYLESLDLSKNQITYLWGLHSFQYLHTLCLSYNCLESFNGNNCEKTNCTFPKLYTLLLDHNYIKSVMNITKQILPVIKHLFLNNNYLQNINGNVSNIRLYFII
uniref:leucine-rich repeat-containing protein 9-like isoform X2 n=1 Tax=Osmia lignaria TaxID=473952 RepID=UPI0014782A72|nr:leucine-rich repeat-containing protein 9-like isoform X2 [Osmia lignaria]